MIGGILQPTTGQVLIRGRLAALLELGAGFHPDLTGRENVYLNASILGISIEETESYFNDIVEFSGIGDFIDTQVKFYSSGMYVRLAFAVAVHVDPDILLVDEVLAVGDQPFQQRCMDRIKQFQSDGRTIVFVSHSLDQVQDLCDRAVVLSNGQIIADGDPIPALKTLRAEFNQVRQEDLEREHAIREGELHAQGLGDELKSRPKVLEVKAYDGDGNVLSDRGHSGDIIISVMVECPSRLAGLIAGSEIANVAGQTIIATNTRILGTPLPPLEGINRIDFYYKDVQLGQDNYVVQGQIASPEDLIYDIKREQSPFDVIGDQTTVGYNWAPITVSLDGVSLN